MSPEIDRWVGAVSAAREAYRLPVRAEAEAGEIVDARARSAVSPLRPGPAGGRRCRARRDRPSRGVAQLFPRRTRPGRAPLARAFTRGFPAIRHALLMDAAATCDADPAATSVDEVILAYPGFYALACHRFAHQLRDAGRPAPAAPDQRVGPPRHRHRHPSGRDDRPGDRDRPRHRHRHRRDERHRRPRAALPGRHAGRPERQEGASPRTRRHPTIEDDVVIYANATILGGDTVVGHSSVIGGNVWLTHSVPPHSIVTNVAVSEGHTSGSRRPPRRAMTVSAGRVHEEPA